jgi:hypothetical protein
MNQSEIILSRAELIFLLKQMGASHVAGVELPELSAAPVTLDPILVEGKQALIARQLINATGEMVPELKDSMDILANRDMALILARGMKGLGQQLFVFNFKGDQILEHTRPTDKTHRLAGIKDQDALLDRVRELVPLLAVEPNGRLVFEIKAGAFSQVRKLAGAGDLKLALGILKTNGWDPDLAENFLQTLGKLEMTFSIACLVTRAGEVVDGSSAAILASETASWGIWPGDKSGDEPVYLVFPTGITDVVAAVTNWLGTRSQA